jgi:hypothetical protein
MAIPYRVSKRSPMTTGEFAHGISVPALTLARDGDHGLVEKRIVANGSQNNPRSKVSRYSQKSIALKFWRRVPTLSFPRIGCVGGAH